MIPTKRTCPVCGVEFVTNRKDKVCCSKNCTQKQCKERPRMCWCDEFIGVERHEGVWVCKRCLEVERSFALAERKRAELRERLKTQNTREELGWFNFVKQWRKQERQRIVFNPKPQMQIV